MGISDFWKVIKDNAPNSIHRVPLTELAGYRLAIDISIYLYRQVRSVGMEKWFDRFISFIHVLKKSKIRVIAIFDGPNPPPEKKKEQEERRGNVEQQKQKLEHIRILKERVEQKQPFNLSDEEVEEIQTFCVRKRHEDATNYKDRKSVLKLMGYKISRMELSTMPITAEIATRAREILEALGLSTFQAEGEAETLCAFLCKEGYVDAVLSDDTDCVVYGIPLFFSDVQVYGGDLRYIFLKDVLEELEISYESFRDMCIFLTCDYNEKLEKVKGSRGWGPVNVMKAIREHGTLEKVESKINQDMGPLNYRRCRELFSLPSNELVQEFFEVAKLHKTKESILKKFPKFKRCCEIFNLRDKFNGLMPSNRDIDRAKLKELLEDNESKFKVENFEELWKKPVVSFL